MARTTRQSGRPPLAEVKRLAKAKSQTSLLPRLARQTRGRTPIEYTNNYFARQSVAPFQSPLARDFDFILESPLTVRVSSRTRQAVADAVHNRLDDLAHYLSNYLTHPRYGAPKQVGFARGDTIRPTGLREVKPGHYQFGAAGIVVGRDDLFKFLQGPLKDPKAIQGPVPGARPGWFRITINMPTDLVAAGVDSGEWYDFAPTTWLQHHRGIPLMPLTVWLRARTERPLIAPRYHQLYAKGTIRIALLFGYDFESTSHPFAKDAKGIWKIVTAPPTYRFSRKENGAFGYHGPGLGFSDPLGGNFKKLDVKAPTVFRRDAQNGGQITVRDPGATQSRRIDAEIRLYNFDKSSRRPSKQLIEQFVSVFRDNDVIHYDGHANYGGGFFIGNRQNDILWALDVGHYARDFSPDYQILSIGACHAAGYFADVFYNELHPRKSPRNLDVVAAMNEADFRDSVHVAIDFIANLLQLDDPVRGRALNYEELLLELNRPASFQSYIGAFGEPQRMLRERPVLSRRPIKRAVEAATSVEKRLTHTHRG